MRGRLEKCPKCGGGLYGSFNIDLEQYVKYYDVMIPLTLNPSKLRERICLDECLGLGVRVA